MAKSKISFSFGTALYLLLVLSGKGVTLGCSTCLILGQSNFYQDKKKKVLKMSLKLINIVILCCLPERLTNSCSSISSISSLSPFSSTPSTLPNSPDEPDLNFPNIHFTDDGAHWYRSSAVMLRFHKYVVVCKT